MTAYPVPLLIVQFGARWIITFPAGAIRAVHREAWPIVSFEDADPAELRDQLRAWEDRRERQRHPQAAVPGEDGTS